MDHGRTGVTGAVGVAFECCGINILVGCGAGSNTLVELVNEES